MIDDAVIDDAVVDDTMITSHGQKVQYKMGVDAILSNRNREIARTLETDTTLYIDDDHADTMSLVDSEVIDDVDNGVADRPISMGGYVQSEIMLSKVRTQLLA